MAVYGYDGIHMSLIKFHVHALLSSPGPFAAVCQLGRQRLQYHSEPSHVSVHLRDGHEMALAGLHELGPAVRSCR